MDELLNQIKVVVGAREKAKKAIEAKRVALEAWEIEHKIILDEVNFTITLSAEAEAKLRELTIKAYQETGNKAPAPGVGIREVIRLEYDPRQALKWAMEHQIALSLDKKSFEGFAKATPLDFVEVYTEPQATIATDLNKVLGGEVNG